MDNKPLVVVESPTKARTISRFLGSDYVIEASNGHIRDLPEGAKQISAEQKKAGWTALGIRVEKDFEPLYVVPAGKQDHVKRLKNALKNASELYLATDEDREGESISWHLLEILKPKIPVKRLVFHEITNEAIKKALASPRSIDQDLVRAQETRRIIDRLFGYKVSELLWRKMTRGLSAGRVQSVAVRMLVEREKERMAFCPSAFWSIKGLFDNTTRQQIEAELIQVGDKRLVIGKDFDPATGELRTLKDSKRELLWLKTEAEAQTLINKCQGLIPAVNAIEEKPFEARPSAPFVTSTLQQESNRKLRLSASRTMSLAQQLYENGFITYMRTDSTSLSEQAVQAARLLIKTEFGNDYLPSTPPVYKTTVKNAQEAHEAIRPAGDSFASITSVRNQLGPDAARLYELIWKRTVASQMTNMRGTRISLTITLGDLLFRASGKTIEFPGFMRAYVEGSDDPEAEIADQERILPKVKSGEQLQTKELLPQGKSTQPPARYTEGSLIKELESRGIGRPSTWATVVETVIFRAYAIRRGNQLLPTFTAFAVHGLLSQHFQSLVDYTFTARLEDDLDAISRGEKKSLNYLRSFYFGNEHSGLEKLVEDGLQTIDPRVACGVPIGKMADGTALEVRIGRTGPYLTDGTRYANIPGEMSPEELDVEQATSLLQAAERSKEALGVDPKTSQPVFVKDGRFGPYVQLGNPEESKETKTVSLLPKMKPEDVTFDIALQLLELPRTLGNHPESGEQVITTVGRYGPYIKCGDVSRSIPAGTHSPLDITLADAVQILKEERPARGRRGQKASGTEAGAIPAGHVLGTDPTTNKPIVVKSGRYGPYLTDGETNVSFRGNLEDLTLDEAVSMLQTKRLSPPTTTKAKKTRAKSPTPKKTKKK